MLEIFKGQMKPRDLDNPGGRVNILMGICNINLTPRRGPEGR
jgi:hypothetical protein